MEIPKWIPWAGLAALVGRLTAIALTAPFAIAYFSAYPGYDIPPYRTLEQAVAQSLQTKKEKAE